MDDYYTLRGHVIDCGRAVTSDFLKIFLGTYELKKNLLYFGVFYFIFEVLLSNEEYMTLLYRSIPRFVLIRGT